MYGGGVGGGGVCENFLHKKFFIFILIYNVAGRGDGGGGWLFTRIKTQELVYTYVH